MEPPSKLDSQKCSTAQSIYHVRAYKALGQLFAHVLHLTLFSWYTFLFLIHPAMPHPLSRHPELSSSSTH